VATPQRKKMKKLRKMRERQFNVLKGMAVLLLLAIAIGLFPQKSHAAPVIVARPVVISRPVVSTASTVRVSPPVRVSVPPKASSSYRSMNGSSGTSSMPVPMPLYVPLFLHGSGASASEGTTVATPLLTKCTKEEFEKAKLWQQDCQNLEEIQSRYCPILSYFRYCKETTPEEAQELKPAGDNYKHVFLTGK